MKISMLNNALIHSADANSAIAAAMPEFYAPKYAMLAPMYRLDVAGPDAVEARVRVYSRGARRMPDGRLMGGHAMVRLSLPCETDGEVYTYRMKGGGQRVIVLDSRRELLAMMAGYANRRLVQVREGWVTTGHEKSIEPDADRAAVRSLERLRSRAKAAG